MITPDTTKKYTHSIIRRASVLFSTVLLMAPLAAQAATGYCSGVSDTLLPGQGRFDTVIQFVVCFLQQSVVPLIIALAVTVFIWGMVKFIAAGESSEREAGKQFMLWGIIGLTVIFCVWGLVNILGNTFGVKSVIPQLPVDGK